MKQETIDRIRRFTADRNWEQFHTPANLAKSISIEANELLECFQWSDTEYDREHVKEELADVMVYSRNLLDELGLDEDEINDYFTNNFKGDCLLAVGDDELIKIHYHTNEPWKVLEYCASLGEIYDIVVEDMDRQSRGLQG